ncbi:unnamed protein product, partial [Adineta ricciae]
LSNFLISYYDVAHNRIRWLCPRCHTFESKKMMNHQSMKVNDDESSPINQNKNNDDDNDAVDMDVNELNEEEKQNSHMDSGLIAESDDDDDKSPQIDESPTDPESTNEGIDDVSYEFEYKKDKAIEELSAVFKLLNIDPIRDRLVLAPIRTKVVEVYRKLNRLCDVLDEKSQLSNDANPNELTIQESNELLSGLKKLYDDSDADERVRVMTIVPKDWGRQKIAKWCVSVKTKSGSTIACFPKKQWNTRLSTVSARN